MNPFQLTCHGLLALGMLTGGACQDNGTDEVALERPLPAESGSLLHLRQGAVQGTLDHETRRFIGIPYAAAPVGALRFRPPQPVVPWTTPLDATGPGVACTQPGDLRGGVTQTEDCLRLNVFAPAEPPASALPVVVWLHGGGNSTGTANDVIETPSILGKDRPPTRLYDGAAFRSFVDQEAVVVTINYRLGALGFLAHPVLTQEAGASGNYGLMDQQAALRWVQDNISAFGGDPEKVTLIGQGSGAVDACYQLIAERSRGSLAAAVLESGTCGSASLPTLEQAEGAGQHFAAALDCGAKDLACLRAAPAERLAAVSAEAWTAGAVVDGSFLREQPREAIAAGRFLRVPMITGNTTRETARLARTASVATDDEMRTRVEPWLGADTDTALAHYPAADYASANDALVALTTDALFTCPARRFASQVSRFAPTYLYSFGLDTAFQPFAGLGAAHGIDVLWVWNVWPALSPYTADEVNISSKLRAYWLSLASGDVNSNTPVRAHWDRYDRETESELQFGPRLELQSMQQQRAERCALWDSLPEEVLINPSILNGSAEAAL